MYPWKLTTNFKVFFFLLQEKQLKIDVGIPQSPLFMRAFCLCICIISCFELY